MNVCVAARIRGHGDYVLSGNAIGGAGGTTLAGEVPKFTATKEGTVRVTHKEYLGEVRTLGNTFANHKVLPLNPGLDTTFPWLSSIAANFEEYEFSGLTFAFVSESADALSSTNTALGSVMMATQYNANLPPLQSKESMLAYEFSNTGRPSSSMVHMVECARRRTVLPEMYVRSGPVTQTAGAPQDYRLYDWGTFQIATQGQQAACVIGELWVTYDVELRKPRLPGPYGSLTNLTRTCVHRVGKHDGGGLTGYVNWPDNKACPIMYNNAVGTRTHWNSSKVYDNIDVGIENIEMTPFGWPGEYATRLHFPTSLSDEYFQINICYQLVNASTGVTIDFPSWGAKGMDVAKYWHFTGDSTNYYGKPYTYPTSGPEEMFAPGGNTAGELRMIQMLIRVRPAVFDPNCVLLLNRAIHSPVRTTDPGLIFFDMSINAVNPNLVLSLGTIPWVQGTIV